MGQIEWLCRPGTKPASWNPVTGCTKVSAGCMHCYAETIAGRFWKGRKFTDIRCHDDRLDAPSRWRKQRTVFVNSMSDLFHEAVPFEFIDRVFSVMPNCPEHTFIVLTKRPERMLSYMQSCERGAEEMGGRFPWPNVWLGVSAENQDRLCERLPDLLNTPAAVRWVSLEPLLGPINFSDADDRWRYPGYGLDWVVVGGESGPKARPCAVQWIESIKRQCDLAGMPLFVKQLGSHSLGGRVGRGKVGTVWRVEHKDPKGADMSEWPEHLRVREWPRA